ncbi:helix-turn-helix domain-containing protein, partial [Bacillus thuringiensis]
MFTHQRQQEILNMLLQNSRWHTLDELAEQAHCAVKTVRRDLHYLKDQLPPEWYIQLMKGKGVKLHKPPHSSQTSIYSFFQREDMQFRVLNQLFHGQVHTITQLADSLYVQVSTLSPIFCRV